jgi:hypothetical protein
MLSRTLQRLVTLLAFTAAVLVPLLMPAIAHAGLLPACESHELTAMPAEWLPKPPAPAPEACSIGEIPVDADPGDVRVAAMCDEHGASVVAPPRVHSVADDRIDAAAGCGSKLSAPLCGPEPKEAPASAPGFALAEHALLGGAVVVPPVWYELAPPFPAVAGAPRTGVKQRIDHPPRA